MALAADRRQQVALPLLALAGLEDVAGPRHQHLQRVGGPPELALHEGGGDVVQAAAAQLFGHVGGIQTGLDGLGLNVLRQLGWDRVELLDPVFVRIELGFDEVAHGIDDHLLLGGRLEIHELASRCLVAEFPAAIPRPAGRAGPWRPGSRPAR